MPFSPEVVAWLERRSEAFAKATSKGPGKRLAYGTGKPLDEKAKRDEKPDA